MQSDHLAVHLAEPLVQTSKHKSEPVRDAFEFWYSEGGLWPKSVERSGDGYKLMQADSSWRAWSACAAFLTPITSDKP